MSTAIIIGAGVTGLSTAYHLAKKNYGRVILLDKGPVGDGSSSRAAGIITGLLWSEPGVLARKKSLELFRELSEELDGYRFQDVGCLNLFDVPSWPDREKLLPLYDRLGAPYEIVSPDEIMRRWPQLKIPADFTGLYDHRGGYSEPDEYIPALTKRIRELGVEVREGEAVVDFIVRDGRMAGVRTTAADIEGDAVVCTVYSWIHTLLERVDLELPVKAFVHQRYVTEPLPEPALIPAVNANPVGGYFRPAAGGRLLAGIETPEREEWRVTSREFHQSVLCAAPELKDTIKTRFAPLIPALAEAPWESERVGLLTYSSDGEPVLGPISALPGLFVGVAFHSGGFAYNPVTGMLLAEYVAEGKTSIDVTAFSPDRFKPEETEAYLASTVRQETAVRRRH